MVAFQSHKSLEKLKIYWSTYNLGFMTKSGTMIMLVKILNRLGGGWGYHVGLAV